TPRDAACRSAIGGRSDRRRRSGSWRACGSVVLSPAGGCAAGASIAVAPSGTLLEGSSSGAIGIISGRSPPPACQLPTGVLVAGSGGLERGSERFPTAVHVPSPDRDGEFPSAIHRLNAPSSGHERAGCSMAGKLLTVRSCPGAARRYTREAVEP